MVSNKITLPAGGRGLEWGIDSMTKDEAVKMTAKNANDLLEEQAEERRIR